MRFLFADPDCPGFGLLNTTRKVRFAFPITLSVYYRKAAFYSFFYIFTTEYTAQKCLFVQLSHFKAKIPKFLPSSYLMFKLTLFNLKASAVSWEEMWINLLLGDIQKANI